MSSEHLQHEEKPPERMSRDEARAVIDLWQQGRLGLNDLPSVPDVAEGLDISVEEVQQLLAEVRAAREERERGVAQEQERLEQELAQLAQERARLAQTEDHLLDLHIQRSEVYSLSAKVQPCWRPRPTYFPKRHSQKARGPIKSRSQPTRLVDVIAALLVALLLIWVILHAALRL